MPHDIIDNRQSKLLDYIRTTLPTTERARFAVGYLFLSGLKPLREQLERLTEIRLLIGNTTDRETIETLAEGYKRLEPVAEAAEAWRYPKRVAQQQAAQATAANLADAFALMNQTDEDEAIVQTVIRLIEERKLKVRVYTRGRWRKMKGVATIQLANGRIRLAEIYWYEAHGVGKKEFKRKRYLD